MTLKFKEKVRMVTAFMGLWQKRKRDKLDTFTNGTLNIYEHS